MYQLASMWLVKRSFNVNYLDQLHRVFIMHTGLAYRIFPFIYAKDFFVFNYFRPFNVTPIIIYIDKSFSDISSKYLDDVFRRLVFYSQYKLEIDFVNLTQQGWRRLLLHKSLVPSTFQSDNQSVTEVSSNVFDIGNI